MAIHEVWAEAQERAQELKTILEPMVLGKRLPAWRCNCGALGCGEAEAVEIEPAGGSYPYQIGLWYVWAVHMRSADSERDYDYSVGLSSFLSSDYLDALFADKFAGLDTDGLPCS